MEEVRKDIIWFEWLYMVSNIWRIRSYDRHIKMCPRPWQSVRLLKSRILKQTKNDGYYTIWLHKNSKIYPQRVHRLVAQAFIPNPENKPEVNHLNWVRTDNRIENLERATNSENQLHAFRVSKRTHGMTWKTGAKNKKSKKVIQTTLSWEQVRIWDSIMDITRELWYHCWAISECCNHKWWYKTYHWLRREFMDNFIENRSNLLWRKPTEWEK